VRGTAIDDEDRLRRSVIMQLMSNFEVDLEREAVAHGFDPAHFDEALAGLASLATDGLCRIEGRIVTVTPQARLFVRNVAARLDAYWAPSPGRHSLAV